MSINDIVSNLAEAIKATPEFAKLKQANSILQSNAKLKKELDDFNQKQKILYSSKISANEAESRVRELNSAYDSLSKIPEFSRYLSASKEFNEKMNKIYNILGDLLDKGF